MKYFRENIVEQFKDKAFFTKEAFSDLAKELGVKETTIDSYLSRSIARKEIVHLKRGIYVTAAFYEKNKNDSSYLFYLANILRGPSYVSLWTALQHYNLTTEAINTITSVTKKVTREFKTKIGTFSYRSMSDKIFNDYTLQKGTFEYYIATPSKALFDLLYFKTNQLRGISLAEVDIMIESLRIDIEEMDPSEREKFYTMIQKHINHE